MVGEFKGLIVCRLWIDVGLSVFAVRKAIAVLMTLDTSTIRLITQGKVMEDYMSVGYYAKGRMCRVIILKCHYTVGQKLNEHIQQLSGLVKAFKSSSGVMKFQMIEEIKWLLSDRLIIAKARIDKSLERLLINASELIHTNKVIIIPPKICSITIDDPIYPTVIPPRPKHISEDPLPPILADIRTVLCESPQKRIEDTSFQELQKSRSTIQK